MSRDLPTIVAPSRRREVIVSLQPKAVDIPTAASIVAVSSATLRNEIAAGRLVARLVGRRTIVTLTALDEWLEDLPATEARP